MDYARLIDAETWAFIEETGRYYPPDAVSRTVTEQRAVYDAMCRAFFQGYPNGTRASDGQAGRVPVRRYGRDAGEPTTVIYFHGGGFVVGGLQSHDDICAEICARTGYRVVSVDYRLAPEHTHPAMYEDALAASQAVLAEGTRVVLVGDSAGGNLAAAVAHKMRGDTGILGQVLIYPGLGGDMSQGSYIDHAHAPLLTLEEILFYQDIRLSGPAPRNDPSYAPLHDTDFAGLRPTVIFTAECDPLSDDGRAYAEAITRAGGEAQWINEPGLVHGYLRARRSVTRARNSFDRIVAAIQRMGRNTL